MWLQYSLEHVFVVEVSEDDDRLLQLVVDIGFVHALGALLQQRVAVLRQLNTTNNALSSNIHSENKQLNVV